jgi:hypothetical protein
MDIVIPPPAPLAPVAPPASPIAAGISDSFLQRDAIELARRIVAELDDPLQLAVAMGLSEAQWAVLQRHPHFLRTLDAARSEANSAAGLADRVRLKALVIMDQGGLLDMAQIMNDGISPATARVAAFNAVMDAAGIAKQKDSGASQIGSGPLVTIIMPNTAPAGRVINHD